MRRYAALALTCILWAIPVAYALAQTPAQNAPAPPDSANVAQAPDAAQASTLSARSALVLVPALVRNKEGELVFTLKADDFVLTDDGVLQKLTLEQDTGGEPLALVVDLEGGGAGANQLYKSVTLAPMLSAVIGNVPHKVAVVGFDSSPVLVQDFTPTMTPSLTPFTRSSTTTMVTMGRRSSTRWASPSTCCANNPRGIAGPFCW